MPDICLRPTEDVSGILTALQTHFSMICNTDSSNHLNEIFNFHSKLLERLVCQLKHPGMTKAFSNCIIINLHFPWKQLSKYMQYMWCKMWKLFDPAFYRGKGYHYTMSFGMMSLAIVYNFATQISISWWSTMSMLWIVYKRLVKCAFQRNTKTFYSSSGLESIFVRVI